MSFEQVMNGVLGHVESSAENADLIQAALKTAHKSMVDAELDFSPKLAVAMRAMKRAQATAVQLQDELTLLAKYLAGSQRPDLSGPRGAP